MTPAEKRDASLAGVIVGDSVRLTADIYDDGQDHHPPGYLAYSGDILIVRDIQFGSKGGVPKVCVSHENVTDGRSFFVYLHEFKLCDLHERKEPQ